MFFSLFTAYFVGEYLPVGFVFFFFCCRESLCDFVYFRVSHIPLGALDFFSHCCGIFFFLAVFLSCLFQFFSSLMFCCFRLGWHLVSSISSVCGLSFRCNLHLWCNVPVVPGDLYFSFLRFLTHCLAFLYFVFLFICSWRGSLFTSLVTSLLVPYLLSLLPFPFLFLFLLNHFFAFV